MKSISQRIANELQVKNAQVEAAIQLLDEGATVPFIARYRKEVTGSLTDTHLRHLLERLHTLRDLDSRRESIIKSIKDQGQMTEKLAAELNRAETKTQLEDLYLPYRPKRRTRATIAREAGLEPLLDWLISQPDSNPESSALAYVNIEKGVESVEKALEGAWDILTDRLCDDAKLLAILREELWQQGVLFSTVVKGQEQQGSKFSDFHDFSQPVKKLPAHRVLALLRGEKDLILRLKLEQVGERDLAKERLSGCESSMVHHLAIKAEFGNGSRWLVDGVRYAWKKRVKSGVEGDVMKRLTEMAHQEAIRVFASNVKDLLLAAPAGPIGVIGLDPGLRTGVKVAAIDATGKVLETDTIYPHPPRNDLSGALERLAKMAKKNSIRLLSIGNGTGSRETEKMVALLRKKCPELMLDGVIVSEAGASVYSASEFASQELPQLDVSIRGAVSIARRLQDPLAELVKIDPRSIGVGQYQHDLEERGLKEALNGVVEDAVNAVGVDINTASAPLLERVSGLNATLAKNIIDFREKNGRFLNRSALKKVTRFGPKAFEQAAGFLRIRNGDNPLDASAVHPESYPLVQRILQTTQKKLDQVMGNQPLLRSLDPGRFVHGSFGEPTVRDILLELDKPGRDPRPAFKTARFQEGVETIQDLQVGMCLEGVVTNITNFGAFVDLGVHQDGLVHISAMADKFVKDPHSVTHTGAVVKVQVLEVDLARKRIALSMKLSEGVQPAQNPSSQPDTLAPPKNGYINGHQEKIRSGNPGKMRQDSSSAGVEEGAMAAAFLRAKKC
ncbi:MAG: RNA-binding transcriptional accessory protein [Magnetococcales bacterium]|nr:RNA-binding transcriptional accessory protein [Magnetococcales bacterium]